VVLRYKFGIIRTMCVQKAVPFLGIACDVLAHLHLLTRALKAKVPRFG